MCARACVCSVCSVCRCVCLCVHMRACVCLCVVCAVCVCVPARPSGREGMRSQAGAAGWEPTRSGFLEALPLPLRCRSGSGLLPRSVSCPNSSFTGLTLLLAPFPRIWTEGGAGGCVGSRPHASEKHSRNSALSLWMAVGLQEGSGATPLSPPEPGGRSYTALVRHTERALLMLAVCGCFKALTG